MSQLRIVVVGDGAVGKSATTIQFCKNQFIDAYDPTIEDTYRHNITVDDLAAPLEIQDTAGQEGFHSLLDKWLLCANGFLVIYSIVSRDSVGRLHTLIQKIKEVTEKDIFPLVIVGNKCDLEDQRQVSIEEGKRLGEKYNCTAMEASAKLRRNIDEVFIDLVRQMRDPTRIISNDKDPFNTQAKKKKKLCVIC